MTTVKKYETIVLAIGAVAHNRPFTVTDLAEYVHEKNISFTDVASAVRKLYADGLLLNVDRGYFPTSALWGMIESGRIT